MQTFQHQLTLIESRRKVILDVCTVWNYVNKINNIEASNVVFSEELLQIKYERVNASKNTIQMFEKFAEKESIFLKMQQGSGLLHLK